MYRLVAPTASKLLRLVVPMTIAGASGCLLLDDLELGSAAGGASATSTSGGTTGTPSSSGATSTSSSGPMSSSTGCATPMPPGNPTQCAGSAPDMTCANDTSCTCEDCWMDEMKCPAALCDHDGTCEPSKETCLCCDCAGATECN